MADEWYRNLQYYYDLQRRSPDPFAFSVASLGSYAEDPTFVAWAIAVTHPETCTRIEQIRYMLPDHPAGRPRDP